MSPYLFFAAASSGILFAFLGYSYGWSGRLGNRILPFLAVFTGITGIANLGYSFLKTSDWTDPRLWLLGVLAGALYVVDILALMKANSLGPASVVWTVINMALLLPVAAAGLFLNEPLYKVDISLILVFTLMLYAFSKGVENSGEVKPENRKAFYFNLFLVFFANGMFMVLIKVREYVFDGGNAGAHGTIAYLSCSLIGLILHLLKSEEKAVKRDEWRAGFVSGFLNGFGFILQMISLALPAVVVFPLNQGISLLGGVVLTMVLFKERINRPKLIGFALGAVLLALTVMRSELAKLVG